MANEDKNKTVFSISEEEEVPKDQMQPLEQPVGEEASAETVKEKKEEPEKPTEEIEHGYEAQAQPTLEPVPTEEKKPEPKGFLSSLFGGGKKDKEVYFLLNLIEKRKKN